MENKTSTATLNSGELYEVDNRLRFENGNLYTTKIPYKGGVQSGPPEMVDVTEDVINMIAECLMRRGW